MSTEMPSRGQDPAAAAKLQILATEHWSLLATRTLTYNESLSRVTIFLTILSGAVIALALVAQVSHFGRAFIAIAIPLLAVVVFTGISTIGRLMQLNGDDFRWVVGMNLLRRAYLDLHPELAPYFITGLYDDLPGPPQTIGYPIAPGRRGGAVVEQVQNLAGHAVRDRRVARGRDWRPGRARHRPSADRRGPWRRSGLRDRDVMAYFLGAAGAASPRPEPRTPVSLPTFLTNWIETVNISH